MYESKELEYLNQTVKDGEAMDKLLKNKDFNRLFIEGFIKEDMVQLGMNITNMPAEKRPHLTEAMLARGIFKQYMDAILSAGSSAKQQLNEMEGDE